MTRPRSLGRFSAYLAIPVLLTSAIVLPATTVRAADDVVIPGAPHLLPEDTLAYIRLDDANDLRVDFAKSSIGKMLNDPKMKPFATDIYKTLNDLFDQISAEVGVSLDDLLSIPSGQVSAAMMPGNISDEDYMDIKNEGEEDDSPEAIRRRIAQKRRQQSAIAGMFMIDAGENVDKLMVLVDGLEERLLEGGYVRRTSKVKKTTLVRLLPPRPGRPEVEYFERDDTVVLGIGHKTASSALDHWTDDSEESTLADSANFASVMSRCVGAEATRPQLTFYVDPYHIVERLIKRGGGGAALAWPIIEELGISKIRGIGGSAFRGGDEFDDITHFHVLIDPPRDGFFGVLRPETGESQPPNWVPGDVTSYTSIYWNFEATYDNVDRILETFQGPEPLKRFVEEPLKKQMGVEIREEVLANLTGRYVTCRWIQPPVKLNSQVQLHALGLSDPLAVKNVIAKLRDKRPNDVKVDTIGGNVVYLARQRRNNDNFPQGLRRPEPCFMILGKWLIFSDSREFIERVTRANTGALSRLVNVPEYELISSELGGKLDGEKPFLVSFLRSSDYFRQLYELAQSDDSSRFLRQAGENNVVAKKMADMLQRNELPSFDAFEKYFAPSGTFAYDEPSGMHMGSFTLKGEE